jgi:hypothetical protein
MGLANTILAATAAAQSVHARLDGMSDTAGGNTRLEGRTGLLTLVYSGPRVVEKMMPGGGVRTRTEVVATMTRAQMSTPPADKTKLMRVDVAKPITYIIDYVDSRDPYKYTLTLVAFT